jgi:hypothetical protein
LWGPKKGQHPPPTITKYQDILHGWECACFSLWKWDVTQVHAFSTPSSVCFLHFTSVNLSHFYKILLKWQFCSNEISYRFLLQN